MRTLTVQSTRISIAAKIVVGARRNWTKAYWVSGFTHLYPWQILSRAAKVRLTCRLWPDIGLDMEAVKRETADIVGRYAPAIHHSNHHHDGGWRAISLIGFRGNPLATRLDFPLERTPAMALAPTLERFIDSLPGEKRRVRLMELRPGKSILWHFDEDETIDDGGESVRLHVPIVTSPRVKIQISHHDAAWKEGELWYGDFSFPHRLFNGGDESRVHLVIDVTRGDSILNLFPHQFLAGEAARLRIKAACHWMVRLYAFGQLSPPQMWERVTRKLGGQLRGLGERLIASRHMTVPSQPAD